MAYRNDRRDNYDRRTRTARDASSRSSASSQGRNRSARPTRSTGSASSAGTARPQRQSSSSRQSHELKPSRMSQPSRSEERAASRASSGASQRPSSRSTSRSSARPSKRTTPRGSASGKSSRNAVRQAAAERAAARAASRAERTAERDAKRAAEQESNLHATPGGLFVGESQSEATVSPQFVSTSVGELRRAERAERLKKSSRRYLMRFILIIGIIVALLAAWAVVYNSPAFTINNVKVNGVEHLTSEEVSQLANIPEGSTLLRVDTDTIANRMKQTAWVEDVDVKRVFPDTLEIDVTERDVQAVVEIPTNAGSIVKKWAIAKDHTWLMPIPDENSDAAKTTSSQIYEDAKSVLHIVDVPYGTKAEIGKICSDDNVNNALDIVSGMTTELADRVVKVSAAGPAETTLILDNGVEIAFGKAEDIRDKERVILKILEENPDGVAYINVRMVEAPTWRAV